MHTLKLIPALILFIGLSIGAKAGTPKNETKSDTKDAIATESKSESQLNTYFVIGISGTNYLLSTTPPSGGCQGGPSPCTITSTNPLGSSVARTEVDNEEDGIEVTEFQPQLH